MRQSLWICVILVATFAIQLADCDGWEEFRTTNNPPGRYWARSVMSNDKNSLLVYGGLASGSTYKNELWSLDLNTQVWTQIPLTNAPLIAAHSMILTPDNVLVICGGSPSGGVRVSTIYKCDLTEGNRACSPTNPPTVPRGRTLTSAVLYQNKIIVFGGGYGSNIPFNDLLKYDLGTDTWEIMPVDPAAPANRTAHTAVLAKDGKTMVVYGGQATSATYFNDVFYYNLETNTWSSPAVTGAASSPHADHTAVITDDNIMWIYGGNPSLGTYTNQLDRYDITANAWLPPITSPTTARYSTVGGYKNNTAIFWGGVVGSGNTATYYTTSEVYYKGSEPGIPIQNVISSTFAPTQNTVPTSATTTAATTTAATTTGTVVNPTSNTNVPTSPSTTAATTGATDPDNIGSNSSSSDNQVALIGGIVGGIGGCILLTLVIALIAFFVIRKRSKNDKESSDYPLEAQDIEGGTGSHSNYSDTSGNSRGNTNPRGNSRGNTSKGSVPNTSRGNISSRNVIPSARGNSNNNSGGNRNTSKGALRQEEGQVNYAPITVPFKGSRDNTEKSRISSYQIIWDELTLEDELGRGAFGVVYKGKWRNQDVAIKKLIGEFTSDQVEEFMEEAELMSTLRPHENVIQFLGFCLSPLSIVTKYYESGSLSHYLESDEEITFKMMVKLLKDISAGVSHLHLEKIIHRDLAARNVLVSGSGALMRCVVSDFGFARTVGNDDKQGMTASTIGPIRWMAPECLLHKEYSVKSDCWSFGVVAWEILTRDRPWRDFDEVNTILQVTAGKRLEIPDYCPPQIRELIQKCWKTDPTERPSFQEIYSTLTKIEKEI